MPCDNCSCSKATTATPPQVADAVPLPKTAASYGATSSSSNTESTPLLWHTTPPTPTQCDRTHLLGRTQCCKDINKSIALSSSHPTFIDPDLIRDVIIGLSDGLSVPFALAAALSALGSTHLVVIGGFAELVSGAISMGVGGYLSARAELDHYNNQAKTTHERVTRSCLAEMKREVAAILEPFGLGDDVAEKVAERLARVEQQESHHHHHPHSDTLPLPASSSSDSGISSSAAPEQGLTPFLLKVGHGLEPISPSRAYISASVIGISYFLGGLVPLIPYMIWPRVGEALIASIIITGIVLLLFGVVKHKFTGGVTTVKAYTWAAVSTLSVGGIAAAASWSIVRAVEGQK